MVNVGPSVYLQCRCGGLRVRGQLKFSRGRRPAAGQETEGGVSTHLRIVLIAVFPSANEERLVAFCIPPLARQLFRYGRIYRQGTVNHGCQLSILILNFKTVTGLSQHLFCFYYLQIRFYRFCYVQDFYRNLSH